MRRAFLWALIVFTPACNCSKPGTGNGDGGTDGGPGMDGGGPGMDGGGTDGGGATSQHIITGFCPGCPVFPGSNPDGGNPGFGNLGDAGACMGAGVDPTLVYPNDGSLFPPNTNVIEIHFLPGAGNQYFEIDFENAVTDVRVETQCNAIVNAVGVATNGCGFELDPTTWSYIAQVNAGGDPLTVTVRGTPSNTSCVAGSNSRTMLFAAQPVDGVIYYWQSVVFGMAQGVGGGVFRYDFGTQAASPSPFLVPSQASGFAGKCLGCHFISRDGQKMTFGADDGDADDEYSDLNASLLDVATFSATNMTTNAKYSPGFQTFSPDHSVILASDGKGANTPPAFFLQNGNTGASATPATVSSGLARGTMPDWSPDGTQIVFVQPLTYFASGNGMCSGPAGCMMGACSADAGCICTPPAPMNGNLDDNHMAGGSLYTMSASGTTFGTPQPLLASTGENNFYPAWSPDDTYVLFNRVFVDAGLAADSFSNPAASIWSIPAGGGNPVELSTLETGGVAADAGHPFPSGGLTNSWPRFSPFVQMYKGKKLYWVTFSSTRDYGLRVQNQVGGEINCYPPEGPENACSGKQQLTQPNCAQPQIWMAALTEDGLASGDTSFPAFWLPFQSVAAHNHIAQWAAALVGGPDGGADGGCFGEGGCFDGGFPDGGACEVFNQGCNPDGGSPACCFGLVCQSPSNTCQFNIQ